MTDTLVNRCLAMSRRIKDSRTPSDIFFKLGEEFGELSQELLIQAGKHYKPAGKDGVIGEALDMIVCLIDLIHRHQNDVTEEQLAEMIQKKLNKWAEKSEQMYPGSTKHDAFIDELKFVEFSDPNVVFERPNGAFEFMLNSEFQKVVFFMDKAKLKGRFEYSEEDGTIIMAKAIVGDLDHARKEYEKHGH